MLRICSFFCVVVLAAGVPGAWAQDEGEPASQEEVIAAPESTETTLTAEQQAYVKWANEFLASLDRKTGEVELPNAVATMTIPDGFYYLATDDARRVLEEAWGNPPDETTLGMIFPAEVTPLDASSWGVDISYSDDGYVSDDDAANIDYAELLEAMKEDFQSANGARIEAGYEPIELIGWAETPHYDAATNKLYWAKELKFGDSEEHTLNYNIRVLGRKGVLVLNFIANMEQLPEINGNLDRVLAMAEFNDGMRYADFNPDIDQVAAYGIGGLIAGKVLAKTGLFAVILAFLKKFIVIIVAGVGAFFARIFKRRKSEAA